MAKEMGMIYMPGMTAPLVFYSMDDEAWCKVTHEAFHHLLENCGWEGICYICS